MRIYFSASGPPPPSGVVVVIVSYSVTRTTPGTGSSTTSMIVSSKTGMPCLGAFLGAIFAAVFGARFFDVARFVTLLRPDLALAFPRFEALLRVARRFFALTMAIPCICPNDSNPGNNIPQQFVAPILLTSVAGSNPGLSRCGELPRGALTLPSPSNPQTISARHKPRLRGCEVFAPCLDAASVGAPVNR